MSNRSSNTLCNTCASGVESTDCISWQGASIECLGIETGDTLTCMQNAIATSLCELVSKVDCSEIVLPACLVNAWGTNDKEVLTFIQFLLDAACEQQSQIDSINTTLTNFNPLISVDYSCCSDNPCVTTGTVTLTVALENIINCICDLKATVTAQGIQLQNGLNSINSYQSQLDLFSTKLDNLTVSLQGVSSTLLSHKSAINCIISGTSVSCPPVT